MSNIVAIVGRPNVGKSTLFNRLVGKRKAIVDKQSGVTRDRIYGHCEWGGKVFSIIDTGGYVTDSDDVFETEIRKQTLIAIEEADIIIFLVDVKNGITDLDKAIAKLLRKTDKKKILAVNKVDNHTLLFDTHIFHKLGITDELFSISAINGSGTGELLDRLVDYIKKDENQGEFYLPRFSFVGRPNVGKSSTVNLLIGKQRNIVTNIAGTTRDSIYTRFQKFGYDFMLVDTAGLRKKKSVTEDIEFYSVMRAVRAIENSDVCVLIIDAEQGIEAQDVNIFHLIKRNKKGVVIMVNKWDLIDKQKITIKDFLGKIYEKIAPFKNVPIVFASVHDKQRVLKVLSEAVQVYKNKKKRISTAKLNKILLSAIEKYPPPSNKSKFVQIKYITQLPISYPAFVFFCNLPQYVKEPYKRFLENRIRRNWNFTGVPIQIYMRKK